MLNENKRRVIIAELIKNEMDIKNISAAKLSSKLGITRAGMSHILNAKVSVNPKIVNLIFSELRIKEKFDYSDQSYNDVNSFLENCLYEYCYNHEETYMAKVNDYLSDRLLYSYGYSTYVVLNLLYLYRNNKNVNEELKKAERLKRVFNKTELQMFYIILVLNYMDNDEWSNALKALKEAKEQASSSSSSSSCTLGLFYLYEGVIHYQLHNSFEGYQAFTHAENIFSKCQCYNRALSAATNLGNIYSQMQRYDKAEEVFLSAAKTARILSKKNISDICFSNLSFLCFDQKRFSECIEYGKKVSSYHGDHLIHMAWSYYLLGDYEKCADCNLKLLRNTEDPYYQMMNHLLTMYLVKAEHDEKIQHLQHMLDYCEKRELFEDEIWIIKLLLAEYEKIQDCHSICVVQRKLLKILGFQSSFENIYK